MSLTEIYYWTMALSPNYKYFMNLVKETNLANVTELFVKSFSHTDSYNKDGIVPYIFKGSQVDS